MIAASSGTTVALADGAGSAAVALKLMPGAYQVRVRDASAAGGWVRTQIGEADAAAGETLLVALTAVGTTETGRSTLQSRLVVAGDTARTVLVRGLGPALAAQGIGTGTVDPVIEVRDANGALIAVNDDWGSPEAGGVDATALAEAAGAAGGAALGPGSSDAAVLVTLAPGAYTVILSDPENPVGLALLEVLAVP